MAQEKQTSLEEAIPQAVEAWGLKFWPLDMRALSLIEKRFGGLEKIEFSGMEDVGFLLSLSVGSTLQGVNMHSDELMQHIPAAALVDGTAMTLLTDLFQRSGLTVEEDESGNPPDAAPAASDPSHQVEEQVAPPTIGVASSGSSEPRADDPGQKFLR